MKNQFQKVPHIGQMLKTYVKENRIFQASWARQQQVNSKTIAKYFTKESMQVSTLFTICQVLKKNFLREIADRLPAGLPPHTPNPLEGEVMALKKENEWLKREIEILEKVVGLKK